MGAEKIISIDAGERLYLYRNTSLSKNILETARLCFRKNGFEKTTISEICSRLKISTSQFYIYFESLDEVLEVLWAG